MVSESRREGVIIQFPVTDKEPDTIGETVLRTADYQKQCRHNRFIVDVSLNEVQCGICGRNLNPMWVLTQLSGNEHRAANHLRQLQAMVNKTADKLRCKCQRCGKMTSIDRF